MKLDDFIQKRKLQKQRKKRLLTLVLIAVILLLLLLQIECERREKRQTSLANKAKTGISNVVESLRNSPPEIREKFKHKSDDAYRWAAPLQKQVNQQKSHFSDCLKSLTLGELEWIFFYNPRTGKTRDSQLLKVKSDDYVTFEDTCLEGLLQRSYPIEDAESYKDDFFKVSLFVSPVGLKIK